MSYSRRAKIYKTEYQEKRDIPFLVSFISNGLSVLEVPCGVGRVGCQLAHKAKAYTIVDIEENMIREAMTNLKDKGIDNLNARVGDLCDIKLDVEFDIIIVPRESIQLLAPDSAKIAIANLGSHLVRQTGILIIDVATFFCDSDPDYFSLNANSGWQEDWSRIISKKHFLKRWSKQIIQDNAINFHLRYEDVLDNQVMTWDSSMLLYKHNLDYFKSTVKYPLHISNIWGDYNKGVYNKKSPRLILQLNRI